MDTIKYAQVSGEDINQVCFMQGGFKDILLIHEFTQENRQNYVVVGKLKKDHTTILRGADNLKWLVTTCKLVTAYKDKKNSSKRYEYENFLNSDITNKINFTKEGYDLITNKFKYLDGEIDRTIALETSSKSGRLRYEISEVISDKDFYSIEYLDNNYFFTDKQINKISKRNFVNYIRDNMTKINKIAIQDNDFTRNMQNLKTPNEKVMYVMQYLAINSDKEKGNRRVVR